MAKPGRSVVLFSALLVTAVAVVGASRQAKPEVTVHEWGTFTSVAGPDGRSVTWAPLSGPQDLPCFVEEHNATQPGLTSIQVKGRDIFGLLKLLSAQQGSTTNPPAPPVAFTPAPLPASPAALTARVRMETPVLYFYAPETTTVNVGVAFHQGVMSEWYPRAIVPPINGAQPLAATVGTILWPSVTISPGVPEDYPRDAIKSHYYAARDVDAAPVVVGSQREKFLFYRGVADFQPSITATVDDSGTVYASAPDITPRLILFENRHGRVGYRVADTAGTLVTLSRPSLDGNPNENIDGLRAQLEAMLTAEGLYPREAKAMVETWRDSWFEEGTRIFYIAPKRAVDARLPLAILPAPSKVARVFVGRLELITPEMKDDVEQAVVRNDLDALNRYGRFLDTVAVQVANRPSMSSNPDRLAGAIKAVAAMHPVKSACQ